MSLGPQQQLRVFTIYRRPADFPNHYVVRAFLVSGGDPVPEGQVILCDSLAEARAVIPPEADARIDRSDGDPGPVVESWI